MENPTRLAFLSLFYQKENRDFKMSRGLFKATRGQSGQTIQTGVILAPKPNLLLVSNSLCKMYQ